MPRSKAAAAAHAAELVDDEENDEEEEEEDEGEDEGEDGDGDEGADEDGDSGDADEDDEDDDDDDEDELDDEWTPPDDVSHWMVRRVVVRPDGRPWVNDAAPMLTFGQDANGVPTKRWTVDEWNAGTLQARFGAGTYQPFWMELKPNGKFRPRGFGPPLTLNDASAPAPPPAPAPPAPPPLPPPTMTPEGFASPPSPPPPTDLLGWDPVMERAFALIPESSRATLTHVRLLDDMLERRARYALETERIRSQQFLQAMQAHSDATLRAILTIVAPPAAAAPPPAPTTSSSLLGLDFAGLSKLISDVKALATDTAGAPAAAAVAVPVDEASSDPAVAKAQTLMAIATIAQQFVEGVKSIAPLFVKPGVTPEAAAAAAAGGST